MFIKPKYYIAKKPDDNGIIKHCIAGFISKTDAAVFCSLPFLSDFEYAIYNEHGEILNPDEDIFPYLPETLQASNTTPG